MRLKQPCYRKWATLTSLESILCQFKWHWNQPLEEPCGNIDTITSTIELRLWKLEWWIKLYFYSIVTFAAQSVYLLHYYSSVDIFPRNRRGIFRPCNLSLFVHESVQWVGTLDAGNREKKDAIISFVHPLITISNSRILRRSTQAHE